MKTFYDLFCKYPVISMQYSVKYELGFIQDLIKILMKMKMLMPAVMVGSRWCYTREGE